MIVLDYRDRRPLYEQVTEKLEELMFSGVLPSDSRLPSVRSMATELSINPNTIQRAYAELERQGYIYSCLLYTSPGPRDSWRSRLPSGA